MRTAASLALFENAEVHATTPSSSALPTTNVWLASLPNGSGYQNP